MKLGAIILGIMMIIAGVAIPTIPFLSIIICGTICVILIILGIIVFILGVVL